MQRRPRYSRSLPGHKQRCTASYRQVRVNLYRQPFPYPVSVGSDWFQRRRIGMGKSRPPSSPNLQFKLHFGWISALGWWR